MTIEYTAHFRFPIPDFDVSPWHAELASSIRAIDDAIHSALVAANVELWQNSTPYVIGDIIMSPETGVIYTCAIGHTSPALPTTFTAFITANPTFWNTTVALPTQRGGWQTATTYTVGDFVVESNRYAVCIVSHVSTMFNADLAAGKWSILVDLSTLGVGINSTAATNIASATTTNVGALAPTRLNVTGAVAITSFGTVANTFKILTFQSTPTVSHVPGTLVLLGGASRTMRAGDVGMYTSSSIGVWTELFFSRADGQPATETERGFIELATSVEAQALTDTVRAITPDTLRDVIENWTISTGSNVMFANATAPTHWTKITDGNWHDALPWMRVDTGGFPGGSVGWSTLFSRQTTDNRTLTDAMVPDTAITGTSDAQSVGHIHYGTNTGGAGLFDAATKVQIFFAAGGANPFLVDEVNATGNEATDGEYTDGTGGAPHTHTDGSYKVNGSGGAHYHDIDMRVKYIAFITCQKQSLP